MKPAPAGDMIILLKDKSEWTSAETKEELMEKMEHALSDIQVHLLSFLNLFKCVLMS